MEISNQELNGQMTDTNSLQNQQENNQNLGAAQQEHNQSNFPLLLYQGVKDVFQGVPLHEIWIFVPLTRREKSIVSHEHKLTLMGD